MSQPPRYSLSSVLLLCWLGILHSTLGQSQTAGTDPNGPIVFHANARTVVVDVVVTGQNGQPINGLHKEDFLVIEDGHPQTIASFEEHAGRPSVQAGVPELPPNVFTNIPRVKPTDSATILLLDLLNTPPEDQRTVRDQMLKYVKGLQPGRPVAIFALGKRLRLVQEFTGDPALLAEALNRQKGGASMLKPEGEMVADQQTLNEPGETKEPGSSVASGVFLAPLQASQTASQTDDRVNATLEALQELARYLTAVSGRKNVMWVSAAFPLAILPDPNLNTAFSSSFPAARNYEGEVRRTDTLLAAAQVAIYPIGATGLVTNSQEIEGAAKTPEAAKMEPITAEHDTRARNPEHATMDQIASETGGIAFYDANGLNDTLARVTDQGAHFYTLTYTPTNSGQDGKYRNIEVKLSTKTYQLTYRRGYYAAGGKVTAARAGEHPLLSVMRQGMPDSTQIRFTLKIQPETSLPGASGAPEIGNEVDKNRTPVGDNRKLKGPLTRYTVEFGIPARDLIFDTASDGARRGGIESMLVVYDQDGKPQNWTLRHFELQWDAAHYELVQVHGIHLRLDIDVPKSGVYLQCGVYDQLSNQAGTLEVPLSSVVADQAAASRSFAEAPSPSSGGPENNPPTPPSETPSVPAGAASGKAPATSSATIAEVPSVSPRTPQDDQAMLSSGKDVSQPQAKTATYVDYPLRTLKTVVPTLNGLKYDANQDQLSSILTGLAKTIDDALVRLPNLVSREEVYRGKQGPTHPISAAISRLRPEDKMSQQYKYLIIGHRAQDGINLEESRLDMWGRPVHPDQGSLLAYGFAYQWLLFSSASRTEFRFRYLGQQNIDGRKTFVVAFAQKPEQVKVPAYFIWGGKRVPMFYQGVLWIDQSTSNIALIRTDLLAPLASVQLESFTTELRFSSVHIHDFGEALWLPREVHIAVQQTKETAEEDHLYSDYHLYHATVRMVASP
jgi:VWFA-related protein